MEFITLKAILFFILILPNWVLSFFLLRQAKDNKASLHLGIMAFLSGIWAGACGFANIIESYEAALFWNRFSWIGTFIIAGYMSFLYYFTDRTRYIKLKVSLWYITSTLITILAVSTSLFIVSIERKSLGVQGTGGDLELVGRLYPVAGALAGIILVLREYFRREGLKKLKVKYLLTGILVYALSGMIFAGILPLFLTSQLVDFSVFFSLFWIGMTSYAVLKYRVMDLQFVLGRSAIYISSIILQLGIAFLIIMLIYGWETMDALLVGVLTTLIIILGLTFRPIFKFFERLAGRYFYYTFYSLQKIISQLSGELNKTVELDELSEKVLRYLTKGLKVERMALTLKEPGEVESFSIKEARGFKKEEVNKILEAGDGAILRCLRGVRRVVAIEEIVSTKDEKGKIKIDELENRGKLEELSKETKIVIFIPLVTGGELIGMILLGEKASGEAYSEQEINLLSNLASQASIAFNNALSYEEVKERKAELEKFHKLTVGREVKMKELKEKNERLREKLRQERKDGD